MNRASRRGDRSKRSSGKSAPGKPRRKKRSIPWLAISVAMGVFTVVTVIGYLITQSGSGSGDGLTESARAATNESPDIPGTFEPGQGRSHFTYQYTADRSPIPFCAGVEYNGAAFRTPQATTTPAPGRTSAATASACRNSNPPSSGDHYGVQRNVSVGDFIMNIPPDPNVYPPDLDMPRDAIPHILEHAGVFVGYNCAAGDSACEGVVGQVTDIVNNRIDDHNNRVVMAHDSDLPLGQLGLASWTRWDRFGYQDFDKDRVVRFISTNSCRFDPENFCK